MRDADLRRTLTRALAHRMQVNPNSIPTLALALALA
jgi:hypothetical protein